MESDKIYYINHTFIGIRLATFMLTPYLHVLHICEIC